MIINPNTKVNVKLKSNLLEIWSLRRNLISSFLQGILEIYFTWNWYYKFNGYNNKTWYHFQMCQVDYLWILAASSS